MTLSWSSSGFRSETQHILAYRHLQVAIRYPTAVVRAPCLGLRACTEWRTQQVAQFVTQHVPHGLSVARPGRRRGLHDGLAQLGNHVRVDEPQAHRTLVPGELLVESVRLSHLS